MRAFPSIPKGWGWVGGGGGRGEVLSYISYIGMCGFKGIDFDHFWYEIGCLCTLDWNWVWLRRSILSFISHAHVLPFLEKCG